MSRKIQTCFILAPAGTNLEVLRDALAERQITVMVPDRTSIGSDLLIELSSILSEVDLVIGVLTRERRSEWVLFELGLAWAKERPIILFVPPKGSAVPSSLHRFLVVRTSIKNREAIGFALDQLLAAPESVAWYETGAHAELHGLGRSIDNLLYQAQAAIDHNEEFALERVVAQALRESGIDVVTQSAERDGGADLAIWSDVLQPILGNPLLIEIKTSIRSREEARSTLQQLSSSLKSAGTRWALLLYGESLVSEDKLWTSAPPNVLILSISSFFEGIRHQSFANVATDLRNRRMHGGNT